ncbi:MAG: hypothetical protein JWR80_8403 [Bradyrhizobium sp.]|nr:hypothetical protein [Bradyrhizobium sp.]
MWYHEKFVDRKAWENKGSRPQFESHPRPPFPLRRVPPGKQPDAITAKQRLAIDAAEKNAVVERTKMSLMETRAARDAAGVVKATGGKLRDLIQALAIPR